MAKKAAAAVAATTSGKLTYYFGKTRCDGRGDQKQLLGGKGANLAEMTHIGLPVPPGFTISTEVCTAYYACGESYPAGLAAEVDQALRLSLIHI